MWIVRLALRRPYTFIVMGLVILLLGGLAIATTPTDIFPEIEIPVVSVIWNYGGLAYPGVSVIKIYFQPNVNVEAALAQASPTA